VLQILLTFFLAAFASSAPASDANSIRHALESRYQHAATLKAIFFERYTDGNGGIVAESGTVYFSRPGRMRWEYESPEEKLFLVDGTNVWFYVPADHTASRAKFKESSDWRTPLALLAGKADLGKFCRSVSIDDPATNPASKPDDRPTDPGNTVLRCLPRGQAPADPDDAEAAEIREVLFEATPDAHLVRVLIRQPGNLETEFRFGDWHENITIPETKFHFVPPSGVSIVDEAKMTGEPQ
jgi:outer membrane lipoprotein carrier protein